MAPAATENENLVGSGTFFIPPKTGSRASPPSQKNENLVGRCTLPYHRRQVLELAHHRRKNE